MGVGKNKSCTQPNPSNICKQIIPTEIDGCVGFFNLMKTMRLRTCILFSLCSRPFVTGIDEATLRQSKDCSAIRAGSVFQKESVCSSGFGFSTLSPLIPHRKDGSAHRISRPCFWMHTSPLLARLFSIVILGAIFPKLLPSPSDTA